MLYYSCLLTCFLSQYRPCSRYRLKSRYRTMTAACDGAVGLSSVASPLASCAGVPLHALEGQLGPDTPCLWPQDLFPQDAVSVHYWRGLFWQSALVSSSPSAAQLNLQLLLMLYSTAWSCKGTISVTHCCSNSHACAATSMSSSTPIKNSFCER